MTLLFSNKTSTATGYGSVGKNAEQSPVSLTMTSSRVFGDTRLRRRIDLCRPIRHGAVKYDTAVMKGYSMFLSGPVSFAAH